MPSEILKSEPGQRINIHGHVNVELHEYKNGGQFTHWYLHPETGDPVLLSLMMRDGKVCEVNRNVLDAIVQAEEAGSFMVAVFRYSQGQVHCHRTTVDYPTDFFQKSVEALDDNLKKEVGPPQQVELVTAEPTQPAINVFSDE